MILFPKILIPAATAALGLGLAALTPQDGPEPEKKATETTKVTVAAADPSADELADLYAQLRRLRAQRLSERPKKLADDAAKLYRQALEATEKNDEAKAKGLTLAAREVARALELSLGARDDGPADPELPPPPKRTAQRVYLYRGDVKVNSLPPRIEDQVEVITRVDVAGQPEGEAKTFTIRVPEGAESHTVVEAGDVRVFKFNPNAEPEKRDVVIRKLDDLKATNATRATLKQIQGRVTREKDEAKSAHAAAEVARKEVAERLAVEIDSLAKKQGEQRVEVELKAEGQQALSRLRAAEAHSKLQDALTGTKGVRSQLNATYNIVESRLDRKTDADSATAELTRAYDAVTKARKDRKKTDDANYLDAARDLYNAARREAEAKRFDRAAQLARAAEALVKADTAISNVRYFNRVVPGQATMTAKSKIALPGSEKAKTFAYTTKLKEGQDEAKVVIVKPKEDSEKSGEVKVEGHRVEVRVEAKADGDKKEEGAEEDVQGIGVMISALEDGRAEILQLIKDGPAGKDGRIKPGDGLVGVVNDKGAVVGFAEKPLADVTKLLRGPADSKVKVVIQPKGSPDLKVYEIVRKKLEVPKAEEAEKPKDGDKPEAEKSGGKPAKLPPIIE